MKNLITFLFLFTSTIVTSQERLTTIVSENTNAKYFVETLDDVNYLFKVNIDGKLDVNILNDDFSLTYLHSNEIKGYFDSYRFGAQGKYIYTLDDVTPLIYNFVDDTEVRYLLPLEWTAQNWQGGNGELMMIGATDAGNNNFKSFLVNADGDIVSDDESVRSILKIYDNYFYKIAPYESDEYRTYYFEHIETGVHDTILFETPRSITETVDGIFYYIDTDGLVKTFDVSTGDKTTIDNMSFLLDDVLDIRVVGDYFLVEHKRIQASESIKMYNVNNGELIKEFFHEDLYSFSLNHIDIVDNKLKIQGSSELFIFDIDSDEAWTYYTSFNRTKAPMIDDRYIFNMNFWGLYYIDILTGEEVTAPEVHDIWANDYAKVVPVGDSYLGIFSTYSFNPKSLFELDRVNGSVSHISSIDNTNEGLDDYVTEVMKFGDELLLASDNIYSVKGTDVTQINPHEIVEVQYMPYQKKKDWITFLCKNEDDEHILYSYNGSDLKEEAVIDASNSQPPFNNIRIKDYIVTDKNVFFQQNVFLESNLMQYNKATGQITELLEIWGFGVFTSFFKSGDDTYFEDNGEVYHIDEEGELTYLVTNEDSNFLGKGIVENNDKCYRIRDNEISIFKGKTLEVLYSGVFDVLPLPSNVDPLASSFFIQLYGQSENEALFVQGEIVLKLEFDHKITSITSTAHNHYLIRTRDFKNLETKSFIFNGNTNEVFDLSELLNYEYIEEFFFVDNIPFMVTRNNIQNKLMIYQLDENYDNPYFLQDIDIFFEVGSATFKAFENEGMLYAGGLVALMHEDFTLHALDVKGKGSMTEIVEGEEGYLYFMGADQINGNQLYRVQRHSFRVSTDDLNPILSMSVYPNPTCDYIAFDKDVDGNSYTILDNLGRVMESGKVDGNNLDVRLLNEGIYFVKVRNEKGAFTGSFVKH